jgi:SAM-dependent methyltransferase
MFLLVGRLRLVLKQAYWDEAAASFDEEPDHGLHPPQVLAAWTKLLERWLPGETADILDIGCGTGSLSGVMAGLGHRVTGIDFSRAMIERAMAKGAAASFSTAFEVMDAAKPAFPSGSFDVLVCRHVLWALPETAEVLQRWIKLLRKNGRLILIEGYWHTGGGLHSAEILAALPNSAKTITVEDLSHQPDYWGGPVEDDRFAIIIEKSFKQ